jgi:hypothetical protein
MYRRRKHVGRPHVACGPCIENLCLISCVEYNYFVMAQAQKQFPSFSEMAESMHFDSGLKGRLVSLLLAAKV